MKLKKAMREYAHAVDDLAFATNAIILADMDLCSPEVFGALVHWRDEARREKRRATRQMHAVMSAMQYRGEGQGDTLSWVTKDGAFVTGLRYHRYLQKYLWRLSRGYASRELKLHLAKRACEFYLRNGDMENRRYFVEDYYEMVFGEKVSLLEH